jgi:hypothetical protein
VSASRRSRPTNDVRMTRWGLLLLVTYLVLGLAPLPSRTAVRAAIVVTVLVIGFESIRIGAI